jgi:hypothetical protein
MRLRAAFALLFQLLLLQVSVLGGGMACAPEWLGTVAGTRAVAAAEPHGSHAAHAAHATHGETGGVPSVAPTQDPAPEHGGAPSHCAATASCAAVAVDAPEVTAASVADVHASVQIGRVSLPPSTHQAPEPPPPRS